MASRNVLSASYLNCSHGELCDETYEFYYYVQQQNIFSAKRKEIIL